MSPRSRLAVAATLAFAAFPGLGATPAHAGTGCTVQAPLTSCMYACVVGERQAVTVYGVDVVGVATCGFGEASCYTRPDGLPTCSDLNGSRSTFTDVYWNACSANPGDLAVAWVVVCTSGG